MSERNPLMKDVDESNYQERIRIIREDIEHAKKHGHVVYPCDNCGAHISYNKISTFNVFYCHKCGAKYMVHPELGFFGMDKLIRVKYEGQCL